MKTIISLLCIVLVVLLFSCEKNITLKPPAYNPRVSIQSMLEQDSIPIVYFNRTVPYFDPKISFADLIIRNAQIKIESNGSVDSLKIDSVYDRVYCQYNYYYKGRIPIQKNKTYTLTIKSEGAVYTAMAQTNQLPPIIDSTSFTQKFNDLYGEHEGVIVYFKDVPSQTNYYRYEMVRYIDTTTKKASEKIASPCLGKDSALVHELGRSVYGDQGLDGQQLKIVIEPAYSHKKGTKGYVLIQSMDKNAYDFFDQLDRQKLAQFNPFVEPVFLKDGQFGSKAFGYFSAMVRSSTVKFVFPEYNKKCWLFIVI